MSRFTLLKFTLAGIGLVVWGYGARMDLPNVRLVGIAVVAVAFVIRFLPARLRARVDGTPLNPQDTDS